MSRHDCDPPSLITLTLLCGLLNQHVGVSSSDLLTASMTAPMYGVLQSEVDSESGRVQGLLEGGSG